MKLWLIFAILISSPMLYVLYFEHTQAGLYRGPGDYPGATVFDMWLQYDRAGFMAFRNEYLGRTAEWDQNIKPLLELRVFPYVILGPILFSVWSFIAWLFGWGPFRPVQEERFSTLPRSPSTGRFARPHAQNTPHKLKYRRK